MDFYLSTAFLLLLIPPICQTAPKVVQPRVESVSSLTEAHTNQELAATSSIHFQRYKRLQKYRQADKANMLIHSIKLLHNTQHASKRYLSSPMRAVKCCGAVTVESGPYGRPTTNSSIGRCNSTRKGRHSHEEFQGARSSAALQAAIH